MNLDRGLLRAVVFSLLLLGIVLGAELVQVGASAPGAAASQGDGSANLRKAKGPFGSFPLSKDVPGHREATLREGNFYGTRWGAFVSRASAASDARLNPCLTVSRISVVGEYGLSSGCSALAPEAGSEGVPSYRLLGVAGGKDRSEPATFFGVLVAPEVVKTTVEFEPGPPMTRKAQLLGDRKRQEAAVVPLRYVAFVVHRDVCVKRIVGFNNLGESVIDARYDECPLK